MKPVLHRAAGMSLISVIVLAMFSGCATYKDPAVKVSSAALTEMTDEAAAVRFVLDLSNPNNEPLTLLEFKYDLTIDGRPVYDGVRAAETVLSIKGYKQVSIPGVIPFEAAGWSPGQIPQSAEYRLNGRLQYITPGKIVQILFDSGVRKPSVPFSSAGQLSLQNQAVASKP